MCSFFGKTEFKHLIFHSYPRWMSFVVENRGFWREPSITFNFSTENSTGKLKFVMKSLFFLFLSAGTSSFDDVVAKSLKRKLTLSKFCNLLSFLSQGSEKTFGKMNGFLGKFSQIVIEHTGWMVAWHLAVLYVFLRYCRTSCLRSHLV